MATAMGQAPSMKGRDLCYVKLLLTMSMLYDRFMICIIHLFIVSALQTWINIIKHFKFAHRKKM